MMSYFLVAGSVLLLTTCCWFWYFRKKATDLHRAAQQRIDELEDTIWRLQMSPHFLNNCLNSLHGMIHRGDNQSAAHYLTSLSRLARKLLEYSEETIITLADELDMVKHYIHLEQLRFGDRVEAEIVLPPDADPATISVPPLFIQPFVENAFIHGLLPQQTPGTITIRFSMAGSDTLCCSVMDSGVGRTARAPRNRRADAGKSFGIAVTRKRIDAFNKSYGRTLPFVIRDLADAHGRCAGTSVEIQLALVTVES